MWQYLAGDWYRSAQTWRASTKLIPRDTHADSLTESSRIMAAALRYRLLLLDHDDTTVASTETIHYPAHIESIRQLRPDLQPCTLEQWFENNLDPGISVYLDSLFSAEQMKEEHSIWTRAMEKQRATFYDGMSELLAEFRQRGGQVAVISHSQAENIRKDYAARTPLLLPLCANTVHAHRQSQTRCGTWRLSHRSYGSPYYARASVWMGAWRRETQTLAMARSTGHARAPSAGRADGHA